MSGPPSKSLVRPRGKFPRAGAPPPPIPAGCRACAACSRPRPTNRARRACRPCRSGILPCRSAGPSTPRCHGFRSSPCSICASRERAAGSRGENWLRVMMRGPFLIFHYISEYIENTSRSQYLFRMRNCSRLPPRPRVSSLQPLKRPSKNHGGIAASCGDTDDPPHSATLRASLRAGDHAGGIVSWRRRWSTMARPPSAAASKGHSHRRNCGTSSGS